MLDSALGSNAAIWRRGMDSIMPKRAPELSAAAVRKITTPGFHTVGGVRGLLLQVTRTGAKTWVLRATVGGKRRDIGLGPYPDVSLKQARERAREYRQAIWAGRDPVAERREAHAALRAAQAASMTFDQAAAEYLKNKESEFRNPKHRQQWHNTLKTYASPVIGDMPVNEVALAHITQILEPIWHSKTETATRLRGRIEHVLNYATVRKYRTGDNPARWQGCLDAVLAKPSKVKGGQNFKALDYKRMPEFMADLRQREGMAARALEFTILTAARSGEVRAATWPEINLDAGVWEVPGEHTKTGRPHRVPLGDDVVAMLCNLPRFGETDLIFPSTRGGQLSNMAMTNVVRRMNYDVTVHGFRSSFRDFAAERTNYANEIIEKCLAHTIPDKVEAAYRRSDFFDKRRRLMRDWEQFCAGAADASGGEVVDLAEAR